MVVVLGVVEGWETGLLARKLSRADVFPRSTRGQSSAVSATLQNETLKKTRPALNIESVGQSSLRAVGVYGTRQKGQAAKPHVGVRAPPGCYE